MSFLKHCRVLPRRRVSALDSMHIDDILGTLAGDDTIFIATDSVDIADFLRLKLIGLSTGDLHPDRRYS